jgi:bifunctional non-homologous end joining protein LigD
MAKLVSSRAKRDAPEKSTKKRPARSGKPEALDEPKAARKASGRTVGTRSRAKDAQGRAETEIAGVRLTNPDRVLWDEQGLTKQELAEYYITVAERVLPHLVNRPLAVVRCPAGTGKACFFQKHSSAGLPEAVLRETVPGETGSQEVLAVRDIRGIVGLVQAGVLEIHPWGATLAAIETPDRMIFDFDPSADVPWPDVLAGAREVRERLKAQRLESFVKTTGGKGLHVVVPLAPGAEWAAVKAFAHELAEAMEADSPGRYLTKASKAERKGRIFIDYLRNTRGATAVAAYSTRARPGAPVSTPLAWDELSDDLRSDHFTVRTLPDRLRALGSDPRAEYERLRQALPKQARR